MSFCNRRKCIIVIKTKSLSIAFTYKSGLQSINLTTWTVNTHRQPTLAFLGGRGTRVHVWLDTRAAMLSIIAWRCHRGENASYIVLGIDTKK